MLWLLLALWTWAAQASTIPVLHLDGGVDPGSGDYLIQNIQDAQESGAQAIIIRMDTPGGLLQSTREIVQVQLASEIPVIVYVEPSGARAGSAGVFITMAAHVAVMAPGTTIGAAHPVSLMGGSSEEADPVMEAKVLNDTVAWARAIAEQRGRSAEFAEAAVRESAALTDTQALEQNVVDLIAEDLDDLLDQLDGRRVETAAGSVTLRTRDATPEAVAPTLRQQVVHFLGDPNVLFVLIGLGMLGLYVEFNNPGMIFPGVLGIGLLLIAGVGLSLLPFNVGGLLLIVFAFVLFAVELWVSAYGAMAALGVVCLVLGGILLFDGDGGFDLSVSLDVLIALPGTIAAAVAIVVYTVGRAHARGVAVGFESWAGQEAVVIRGGGGEGWVQFQGENWRARWSPGAAPTPGDRVRVRGRSGLELEVEPIGGSTGKNTGDPGAAAPPDGS